MMTSEGDRHVRRLYHARPVNRTCGPIRLPGQSNKLSNNQSHIKMHVRMVLSDVYELTATMAGSGIPCRAG